jgi:hypothetical protein
MTDATKGRKGPWAGIAAVAAEGPQWVDTVEMY